MVHETSASSIKTWADLQKLFLTYFFEADAEISMLTLLASKQKKGEYQNFRREISEYDTLFPSSMTQSTLVEMRRHYLQTSLLAQMGVAECRTWKQLGYKANRRKRSSPGSRLKKKTANRDPTSQCDARQSLLSREEEIL